MFSRVAEEFGIATESADDLAPMDRVHKGDKLSHAN